MHRGSLSIDRGINAIYSFIRLFLLYCKFLPTGSREEPKIPIEWSVFEYKFASNPRYAFESLSYAMFCIEFNINYGAFRYFNQPNIETQPVDTHDGYITGFQAKYYTKSSVGIMRNSGVCE